MNEPEVAGKKKEEEGQKKFSMSEKERRMILKVNEDVRPGIAS